MPTVAPLRVDAAMNGGELTMALEIVKACTLHRVKAGLNGRGEAIVDLGTNQRS
jgi:hypothetical protein